MYVREFMTSKLVTVTSDTPIARASRLLYAHKVRRLPVVDDDKLVGIIGDRAISASLPSAATGLSSREVSDTLKKNKVRQIMQRDVITVTPDTTAESALALAQENKIGCFVVVDDQYRPVGIVTTNDFIYRFLNPLLGLGQPGVRLQIHDCGEAGKIKQVAEAVEKHQLKLEVIHIDESRNTETPELIIQVVTKEPQPLMDDLAKRGFDVKIRKRKSWPLPGDD